MDARVDRRKRTIPITLLTHNSQARMKIGEATRRKRRTACGELKKRLKPNKQQKIREPRVKVETGRMDRRMTERPNDRTTERPNDQTNERTKERTNRLNEQTNERTNEQTKELTNSLNEQTNERINERTNERKNEQSLNEKNERRNEQGTNKRTNELTRDATKRNVTKQAKCSYLPLVATHADQHVHKLLKAWRVSSVSKLGFSVVHDVFSGPLRNLFSTQHQLQFLWSERTKLLHRKHRVKPV